MFLFQWKNVTCLIFGINVNGGYENLQCRVQINLRKVNYKRYNDYDEILLSGFGVPPYIIIKEFMEAAKAAAHYKLRNFDIALTPHSDKKLSLLVSDQLERVEFEEKQLTLSDISVSTLMKAFEQNKIEIKLDIKINKTAEDTLLQIDILVSSQFLKPVEETILLKKKRDITESEVLTKAVEHLGQRMRDIKEKEDPSHSTYCGKLEIEEKYYSSANFETVGSIKLPKGKYLLSISFLLKTNHQMFYLLINQNQQLMQGSYLCTPTSSYFMPHTIKKNYNINGEEEVVNFNAYSTNSYPATLRNVVVTAKRIQ